MSTPICTVDLPGRASAYHTPSRVHATLFEVELALEAAQHVVADLALGPKPQQRLAFGVDDGASDLPVLDELAVFAVAVGGFALTLDVLGAMAVRLAELIEEGAMPRPHRLQLVQPLGGRLQEALSRSGFFFADSRVRPEAKRPD
jgi:hypothetical protein